jgi:hypothetical protein
LVQVWSNMADGIGPNCSCISTIKLSLCLIATQAPLPAEGPVFFKRKGIYYILGGTTCCACRGGSSVYVFTAPAPLGPWTFRADIGSSPQHYDPHAPNNYVTRAQASDVFQVVGSGRAGGGGGGGGGSSDDQWLWLGNQWVTGPQRNRDLQCVPILLQNRHSSAFLLNPCSESESATHRRPRRKDVLTTLFICGLQGMCCQNTHTTRYQVVQYLAQHNIPSPRLALVLTGRRMFEDLVKKKHRNTTSLLQEGRMFEDLVKRKHRTTRR